MADLRGGTTIGGYLAIHAGILDSYLTQNGIKSGCLDIYNSINPGNFSENLRLPLSTNNWSTIVLGCAPDTVGSGTGIWSIHRNPSGNFAIAHNASEGWFELTQSGTMSWMGNTVLHSGNFISSNSSSSINPDNTTINGLYYATGVSLFGQVDGALYNQAHSPAWQGQILQDYRTGNLTVRGKNGGTWTPWQTVWSSETDGSGSGLDADLLDGNHGSHYYRKLASRTAGEFYTGTTAPASTNRINFDGYFYATRVYNAWFNDYAEYFEKGEETEPGDIISLDPVTKKYVKSRNYADKLVRGIHSNEYAQCIGGDGKENVEDRFIPLGLSGRTHVKIIGKANTGQYVISYGLIPGIGIAVDNYIPGATIGQCEEDKDTDDIGLIRMFIKYL